jgi:hypothetical protein
MRAYLATKRELFDAWRRGVLIAPAHRRDFFDQLAHEAKLRERRGDSTAHIWGPSDRPYSLWSAMSSWPVLAAEPTAGLSPSSAERRIRGPVPRP